MIDYNAFTCTSTGILNRLCTEVYVLSKYNIGDSLHQINGKQYGIQVQLKHVYRRM